MQSKNSRNRATGWASVLQRLLDPFRIKVGDDEIKKFYMAMREYSQQPRLYVKFNRKLNNLECLIATDLSAAFDMQMSSELPERKALLFLRKLADMNILGLDAGFLKEAFFLKTITHSDLGTHCVFGLRYESRVLGENCFVVHLDNERRIVMVYCTYQQFPEDLEKMLEALDDDAETEEDTSLPLYVEELEKAGSDLKSANEKDSILSPDWSSGTYLPLKEIEVVTAEGNFIWLVDDRWRVHHQYPIHAEFSRSGLGIILDNVWYGDHGGEQHERELDEWRSIEEWPPRTKKVMLRDLNSSEGHLKGKYVKVEDQITKNWTANAITFESDPTVNSSFLDRLQAYYHIDYIQRYFRHLGLTVLDKCDGLNPLRVVLTKSELPRTTSYMPNEKTIYLKQIPLHKNSDGNSRGRSVHMNWTDARDCMVIYHEYVHAVTDALASLRHQNLNAKNHPRYRDMLQAAAMDEGLADYFACSIAVANGAKAPKICLLRQVDRKNRKKSLARKVEREITQKPRLQIVHQTDQELSRKIIYHWGQEWSRFLWQLRNHEKIGVEVADTLIAHSILFLTRWSSFSMGILAIMLADQLLFGGTHRALIQSVSALNIEQVSKKPRGSLKEHIWSASADDRVFHIDFGLSANGINEEVKEKDNTLEFGIDPYIVDEWVFEGDELFKTRYRIDI